MSKKPAIKFATWYHQIGYIIKCQDGKSNEDMLKLFLIEYNGKK